MAPVEVEYVATFIDLSSALIYRDDSKTDADPIFEKQLKEVDLRSLGLVLNQFFRGEERATIEISRRGSRNGHGFEDIQGDTDDCRRKRGKQHTFGDGLPLYLGTLISALLETTNELSYESVKDVFLDLKIMAEDANDCLSKSQMDESTLKSRLRLGSIFYGRQVQMSMLLHLFQSSVVLGNQPLMATISGCEYMFLVTKFYEKVCSISITDKNAASYHMPRSRDRKVNFSQSN